MTYGAGFLMAIAALALAFTRRRHRAEAATILVVALPVVLSVAYNAQPAYESLRANFGLDSSAALALAPPVIATDRNLPLARKALASMASDARYAVVPDFGAPRRTAAARRERARFRYLDSWFQYWLAPRIRVDPPDAQWLILLDAKPPPQGALEVYQIGNDVLVRSK